MKMLPYETTMANVEEGRKCAAAEAWANMVRARTSTRRAVGRKRREDRNTLTEKAVMRTVKTRL